MAGELEALVEKVGKLEVVVGSVNGQLYEIKAALDTAISNNNMQQVIAVTQRIGAMYDSLKAAAEATDITPETPVEPPVEEPPAEPTP